MTLGQRIKYYRQLSGLSQEELSAKIGADARTISNYETGKYKPSADTIVLLARAFQVSTDKLLIGCDGDKVQEILGEKDWTNLFLQVAALSKEDKKMVKKLLNYLILKNKSNNQLTMK